LLNTEKIDIYLYVYMTYIICRPPSPAWLSPTRGLRASTRPPWLLRSRPAGYVCLSACLPACLPVYLYVCMHVYCCISECLSWYPQYMCVHVCIFACIHKCIASLLYSDVLVYMNTSLYHWVHEVRYRSFRVATNHRMTELAGLLLKN